MSIIRWGILGTGYVAREFARGLDFVPEAKLVAIGSRREATAQEFAARFNIPKAYGSYPELAANPDIDIVYIATPPASHVRDCKLCLNNGKAVLCEKPFTLNAQEAREVIDLARQQQLFCMEAMWMRFMPLVQRLPSLLTSGEIGEVRLMTVDFGVPVDSNSNLLKSDLGGGTLLDRGIYGLSLAFYLLGQPKQIVSQAAISTSGVDEQSAVILGYPQGQLVVIYSSLNVSSSNEVVIFGTQGQLHIHEPFCRPHRLSISPLPHLSTASSSSSLPSPSLKQRLTSGLKQSEIFQQLYRQFGHYFLSILKPKKVIMDNFKGNGYNYEAAAVTKCLQEGKLESPTMPLNETLSIMEVIDTIRHQWHSQSCQ